jgi:1,4-alpha-glucan branching enzyme
MGWMNDTLRYMALDPIYRGFDDTHKLLTFRGIYAFTENYMLALSHDEVVHGKRSLLGKNPGDEWQRFAGHRTLLGYQWSLPGKKLVFMGTEIADPFEWNHSGELPFYLLDYPLHRGVLEWTTELNDIYRNTPALHLNDVRSEGFQWIEANDVKRSTLAYLRAADGHPPVLVVVNFTPEVWYDYRVGVPSGGTWSPIACSDDARFGGSGAVPPQVEATDEGTQGMPHSIQFAVPPMSVTFFMQDQP